MTTTDYASEFQSALEEINQLELIPERIRDHAVSTMNSALKLNQNTGTVQAQQALRNGRDALRNISKTSIASNYGVIYTQMCVLAVSSLEATLKRYFENAIDNYRNIVMPNTRLRQIKISLEDIVANDLRFGGKLGKLVLEKEKPNFQDLKSIKAVFKEYFGKDITLASITERNIIFYLESRHVIVHKGGVADTKFVEAVNKMNANMKGMAVGERIELNNIDWDCMQEHFVSLIQEVTKQPK